MVPDQPVSREAIEQRDQLLFGEAIDWDSRRTLKCGASGDRGLLSVETVTDAVREGYITTENRMYEPAELVRVVHTLQQEHYHDGEVGFELQLKDGTHVSDIANAAWIDGFVFVGYVRLGVIYEVCEYIGRPSVTRITTLGEDVEPDQHRLRFWWD